MRRGYVTGEGRIVGSVGGGHPEQYPKIEWVFEQIFYISMGAFVVFVFVVYSLLPKR